MDRNHGNLKKHRYLSWFKGRYGVHDEVNDTEEGKGRTGPGTDTGTEGAGQQGRNEEGNVEYGRRVQAGRVEGQRGKPEIRQYGMCICAGRPTNGKLPIIFGTYNIRNGRNGGLEAALRGMSQANMDLIILQETKLTHGIYTRGSDGYSVVATDAPSRHRSSVAIFHRPVPHFAVEAVQKHRPNVIGFQLATGGRRWYIVGCYLVPQKTLTIERVVKALRD